MLFWEIPSIPCLAVMEITKRSGSKYEWEVKRREGIRKEYMQMSKTIKQCENDDDGNDDDDDEEEEEVLEKLTEKTSHGYL
jgi:hypothetical protein